MLSSELKSRVPSTHPEFSLILSVTLNDYSERGTKSSVEKFGDPGKTKIYR